MKLTANRNFFETMPTMFCRKWKELEPNFIEYFRKEWLGDHSNWFEGAPIIHHRQIMLWKAIMRRLKRKLHYVNGYH